MEICIYGIILRLTVADLFQLGEEEHVAFRDFAELVDSSTVDVVAMAPISQQEHTVCVITQTSDVFNN